MILASNPLYCLKPFEEVLHMVKNHFDGWEFLAEKEHGWGMKEHILDVMSTVDTYVQVHAPFNDINLASINPRIAHTSVKEIEHSFRLASLLGSDVVTVHPGIYSPLGRFWTGAKERAHISMKRLSDMAEEHGITCALENMPNFDFTMGVTPEEISEFIGSSGLAFCFDVGHANTCGYIDEFLEFVPANVHLHDNHGHKDEHLALGAGNIDFPRVIKKIHKHRCHLVIEGRDMESLVKSKGYLDNLLDKL